MMFKTNHALIGALLSTTVLAGTAEAAPIYRNWDENGVDVVQGDFRLDFTEASIGSGKAMRVLQRVNNSLAPSQWDLIRFQRTSNGTTVTTRITMADGSDEVFTGFTNTKKDGGTLTQNSDGTFTYKDRNDVAYLFYNPEPGTATDFCGSSSGYPCELLLQSITSADLSTTTLTWDVVGSGTNHDWRLRKVANSYAFSIDFTYQSNTPGSTAWSRRTSAAFVRGASTIHTVSYAYPSSGVTDITDPTNNVWRITATSIKRPTETTPGFIVTQSGGVVTAVTDDGVTTAYSRQVSGNMVTLTKTDPLNNQTVIVSDLAKARPTAITDPLGHTTQYRYDSDGRLEKITLPEGNGIELSERRPGQLDRDEDHAQVRLDRSGYRLHDRVPRRLSVSKFLQQDQQIHRSC